MTDPVLYYVIAYTALPSPGRTQEIKRFPSRCQIQAPVTEMTGAFWFPGDHFFNPVLETTQYIFAELFSRFPVLMFTAMIADYIPLNFPRRESRPDNPKSGHMLSPGLPLCAGASFIRTGRLQSSPCASKNQSSSCAYTSLRPVFFNDENNCTVGRQSSG